MKQGEARREGRRRERRVGEGRREGGERERTFLYSSGQSRRMIRGFLIRRRMLGWVMSCERGLGQRGV